MQILQRRPNYIKVHTPDRHNINIDDDGDHKHADSELMCRRSPEVRARTAGWKNRALR